VTDNARFQIKNGRITRLSGTDKVSFVTVHAKAGKYDAYIPVIAFEAFPFGVSDVVTVSGQLSMAKPRNGGKEWTLQLVAKKWEKGDEKDAPEGKPAASKRKEPVDDDPLPF
jgi:hypothetical protein